MSSPLHPYFSKLQVSKKRSRSKTESLLPPSFDSGSEESLSTPTPENDRKSNTKERFQKSLEYCQKFLARRNISPRSEMFMMVFIDEFKIAI